MSADSANKPVIGLAGGIGSGKSFVAAIMRAQGCAVIDSDALARQAMDEPEIRRQVVAEFGQNVLMPSGEIDRRKVAQQVFGKPDSLAKLEGIIHPYVHEKRYELRQIAQDDPSVTAIVEDCPLLFEKQLDADCDHTIFVSASREVRLARVSRNRGWSDSDLASREKNQLELDMKALRADYVVNNEGDTSQCEEQVRLVLSRILRENQ